MRALMLIKCFIGACAAHQADLKCILRHVYFYNICIFVLVGEN